MARPKKYDDDLREALLAATAAQIARAGVDSVALRPLATANNTSTSAVYAMFGSRAALIDEVVIRAGERFLSSQVEALTGDDPLDDLRRLGRAYRRWALAHADLYRVMFAVEAPTPPPDDPADEPGIQPLLSTIDRALDAGQLAGDRLVIAFSVWAGVHGWVMLESCRQPLDDSAYDNHLDSLARAWQTAIGVPGR